MTADCISHAVLDSSMWNIFFVFIFGRKWRVFFVFVYFSARFILFYCTAEKVKSIFSRPLFPIAMLRRYYTVECYLARVDSIHFSLYQRKNGHCRCLKRRFPVSEALKSKVFAHEICNRQVHVSVKIACTFPAIWMSEWATGQWTAFNVHWTGQGSLNRLHYTTGQGPIMPIMPYTAVKNSGLAGFCQKVEKRFFHSKNRSGKNTVCRQK